MLSRILLRTTRLTTRSPRTASTFSHDASASSPSSTHGAQSEMDASSTTATTTNSTDSTAKPPLLALPSSSDETTTRLDVSGEGSSVKLDHLGPLVVNTDGTMSRIGNWAQLAPVEKENALRILAKRNKERLEVLRKKDGAGANEGQ
ncbi:hypothetical protein E4U54_004058 [Claviceps lovelessii]|nr:hypothetical protein E4U54_004058 [Claviceps lovelessii]